MKTKARGRPRTSPLTRAEQLRVAKRAQRKRQRRAGLGTIELRLPAAQAARLRVAAPTTGFESQLQQFLEEMVVDINQWPALSELAWNRTDRWIPAEEAFALYERNWRLVDQAGLTKDETDLIDRLKHRFGGGMLNV